MSHNMFEIFHIIIIPTFGFRSHGSKKVVSTVCSKQSSPKDSLMSAPVTLDLICAALVGAADERV